MSVNRLFPATLQAKLVCICTVVLALAASLASQTPQHVNRITQELTSGPVTTAAGTVHPLTRRATDLGAMDSKIQLDSMTLNISLSASQQADLNALLAAQLNPASPQYHQWLTQEEFGAHFGLTDADLNKITGWLAAQGFTVRGVSNSRNAITFGGKVWQVESAFHTQLHQYQLDGETHFANATDLRVPAGLAAVMVNVRGLNSFRPKAHVSRAIKAASPQFTTGNGYHFLAPGDWATIYGVSTLYGNGFSGTGAHVGIVGQTYAPKADIDHFRSAAGLTSTKINYVCISSVNCSNATGTSTDGDLLEADLDIEWSGGIAQNATVDFIYSAHGDTTLNVFDALQYAIQQYKVSGAVVPVLSMSYETCEQDISAVDASLFSNLSQQANSQGQTILVSSGDSGGAGCDPHGNSNYPSATVGLSAGVPADVPNVTAVGGTTLVGDEYNPSLYWNSTTTTVNTALQYIPETVWNDSSGSGLAASGGGVSTLFPQPGWQWTPTNFSGTSGRFVPDVAFAASPNHDGYLTCSQVDNSATYGTSCTNGFVSSANYLFLGGGTSASAPSFAGMLTLLTQKYGVLGNINPFLYGLASNPTTYAAVFHDVASGDNIVSCISTAIGCVGGELGYQAATGYDLTTGLGSIDAGALYTALASASKLAVTSIAVTATPNSLAMGTTTTLSATVSSTQSGTPTGTVAFAAGSTNLGAGTISNGTAVLTGVQITPANGFTAGTTALINASYSGDASFAASSASTTMTLAALPATTTTVTATPSSVIINVPITLSVSVSSAIAGSINGPITFKVGSTTIGTATLSNGSATLTNVVTSAANGFSVGNDTITASYGGDPLNYAASSGTTTLVVQPLPATTTALTFSPNSLTAGGTTTLTATVTSTATGAPSGTVTFVSQYSSTMPYTLGTANVSGGTATLSVQVSSARGLFPGTDGIMASYSGDTNFAPSSGTSTLTVVAIPTTISVTVAPTSATQNSSVTFAVTLSAASGVPNGYVSLKTSTGTYFDERYVNGSGTTYMPESLSSQYGFVVGSNTVTASFTQNGDYASSSATTTVTVTPQPATTTTITATPSTVAIGGTTTLTATVTSTASGTPTGTVTFADGGYINYATLSNGTASVANVLVDGPHGFTAGSTVVTASYNGDSNFASSSGRTSITVTGIPSTTTVTASPSSVPMNGIVNVSAAVSGSNQYNPTGAMTLKVGSNAVGVAYPVSGTATWNGVAVTSANGFSIGSNTLTVSYAGDADFTPSNGSTVVTVVPSTYTLTPGTTAVALSPGASTSVALSLNSTNYAGTVSFQASTSSAAISANASSITLTSGGSGSGTLLITASSSAANHAPALPWKGGGATILCAILFAAPFNTKRKRAIAILLSSVVILAAGFLVSCGGGGGGTARAPRTYTVTVTPTGTGTVTNPSPVSITVTVQ